VRVSTPAGGAFASVTIQQTDLVVFGPTSITLQPGATYEVQSNPFGRSVQYTAFGGSFSGAGGNIYTAPPNAGNYHFIVSFGSQSVRIDVHVPLVITPAEVNLELGATFQFTANAPGAAWSVSSTTGQPGQITSSGFYTAPTSGGTVAIVTASLAGDSATAIVLFLTVLPYNPTYAVEGETLARAVVVYTEAGDLKGRLKGPIKKTYQLHFDYRDKAELLAVLAFHSSRFPEIPILFHDHNLDIFVACYFDSQVKWQVTGGGCAFSYSFRLKEA
jgi:hypothetical protein